MSAGTARWAHIVIPSNDENFFHFVQRSKAVLKIFCIFLWGTP